MALTAGTVWEFNASATASMVNGGGFNPTNAGMLANLTTDSNTANTASPVCSSASYNFVAGDVGNWLYIKSGTNWTPGWYQIASVASNKATLSAAIGAAIQVSSTTTEYSTNTVVGCATVGTPTNGTFAIDYSQATAAVINGIADFTAVGASVTLTSATAGFTPVMVGNIFHQTTTGTGAFGVVGWYEIATYTNATTVTLDRTPNSGTASVACTGYVGGAMSLNSSLEDSFFEALPAASIVWWKNATFTVNSGWTISSGSSSLTQHIPHIGYNSKRGDNPTGASRPTIAAGGSAMTWQQYNSFRNIISTTSASLGFNGGSCQYRNCKFLNTSTTASRTALTLGSVPPGVYDCEIISQNGFGASTNGSTAALFAGNYVHDCATGYSSSQNSLIVSNNLIIGCSTAAITLSTTGGQHMIVNNTIYGRAAKIGTGVNFSGATSPNNRVIGNNIYGFTTGIAVATSSADTNVSIKNNYYNNTSDVSNWTKSSDDTALDPIFSSVTEITGTTATTSGSTLTQSSGDFSTVTDNIDFLHVVSGTGVTVGCYLITGHTSTTLTTNNALGTSSGGDVVYWIITGTNFTITNSGLKAVGFPARFNGSDTNSYPDIGAVQAQAGGGAAVGYRVNLRTAGT